jgi:putative membrane protein
MRSTIMSRSFSVRYWSNTEPEWDQWDVPWIVRMAVRFAITVAGFLAAREVVNWLYDADRIDWRNWGALIAATAVFVVVRAVLRPVLMLLTCPLQFVTLGLFVFVINAGILLFTDWLCDLLGIDFVVNGFFPALIGAFVVSVVSFTLSRVLRRNPFGPRLT